MNDSILTKLYLLFKQHVPENIPNEESQMCSLWSTKNPPNVLEITKQHEDIETIFDIDITEDDAVKMYDMNLLEASKYIQKLIDTSANH